MGLSLPLLARGAHRCARAAAARVVGSLYGWNTLGAAVGRILDAMDPAAPSRLRLAVSCVGAAINVSLRALGAAVASRGSRRSPHGRPPPVPPRAEPAAAPAFGFAVWLAVYALSGAIALSLEIAWFRVIGVMVKTHELHLRHAARRSISPASALGSIVGRARWCRAAPRDPVTRFLGIQTAVTAYALLALAILVLGPDQGCASFLGGARIPTHARTVSTLPRRLRSWPRAPLGWLSPRDAADPHVRTFLLLYFAIPLLLLAPADVRDGALVPLAAARAPDRRTLARAARRLAPDRQHRRQSRRLAADRIRAPSAGSAAVAPFAHSRLRPRSSP